jgi:hypothetical protein
MFGKHAAAGEAGTDFRYEPKHLNGIVLIPHGDIMRVRPDLVEGALALDSGDNDPNARYKLAAFDVLSN